ncbi:MAG: cyclic nucleotide-binding domain-containing protein [bacterium]|nr:cyclic nucleotide-binding domain-containing protein [bacterium]
MLTRPDNSHDIDRLIARGKYAKAIKLLRRLLRKRPESVQLRQQLADSLARHGDSAEAVLLLDRLVDEFANAGFVAKAIALLKKMQRIDPERPDTEEKLARLVMQRQEEDAFVRAPSLEFGGEYGFEDAYLEVPEEEPAATDEAPALPGIDRVPLFSHFSTDELVAVIRGLQLHTYEAGEILFTEGQPGESLLVLASGAVRVYVRDAAGGNRQVRRLGQGEFFGEISLLSGEPRTATITAAEECEVLELDRETVVGIAEQYPKVREILREFCLERAGSAEEKLARREA